MESAQHGTALLYSVPALPCITLPSFACPVQLCPARLGPARLRGPQPCTDLAHAALYCAAGVDGCSQQVAVLVGSYLTAENGFVAPHVYTFSKSLSSAAAAVSSSAAVCLPSVLSSTLLLPLLPLALPALLPVMLKWCLQWCCCRKHHLDSSRSHKLRNLPLESAPHHNSMLFAPPRCRSLLKSHSQAAAQSSPPQLLTWQLQLRLPRPATPHGSAALSSPTLWLTAKWWGFWMASRRKRHAAGSAAATRRAMCGTCASKQAAAGAGSI